MTIPLPQYPTGDPIVSFCPRCGSPLRVVDPDTKFWGSWCKEGGPIYFLCTKPDKQCPFVETYPLVLIDPIHGYPHLPSCDNWAIGVVS